MPRRRSGTKRCTDCKRIKPITDFYPDLRCSLGVKSACKECCAKKTNEYGKTERGRQTKARHRDKKRGYTTEDKYHLETTEGRRRCRRCDMIKPLDEFVPRTNCKFGRQHICKECYGKSSPSGDNPRNTRHEPETSSVKGKYWLEETEGKRVCRYCNKTKPLEDFRKGSEYSRYGRTYECNDCCAKGVEAKRQNPEYREKERLYRRTEKALANSRKNIKKYRERHPERKKAVDTINNMVKAGTFPKASMCVFDDEMCSGRFEHHHFNYSNPDEAIPLCKYHHDRLRRGTLRFQKQIEQMLAELTD